MAVEDTWDPGQYDRFARERRQPFWDLLDLVEPPGPLARVVDLGCGTGALTAALAERWRPSEVLGVDNSPAMLAEARPRGDDVVRFERGDLARPPVTGPLDVVVANASLQWVPDHPGVLTHWAGLLGADGQLAVQVPANADHPAHRLAAEVASEPQFAEAFGGFVPADPVLGVLRPEAYAELLDRLGFGRQHVRLQVYGHHLARTEDVVEWLKGTSLNRFRAALPPDDYARFLTRFRDRLLELLGDRTPYFYAFKRILMWGRREP